MDTRFARYFGTAVCGLTALIFFSVGITQILAARRWIRAATRVTGTVVRLEETTEQVRTKNGGTAQSSSYVVDVSFEADGITREVSSSSYLYRWLYKVGQQATVLYTPGDPDDAVLDSAWNTNRHLYASWISMVCLGLMFAIGAILCFKLVRDM